MSFSDSSFALLDLSVSMSFSDDSSFNLGDSFLEDLLLGLDFSLELSTISDFSDDSSLEFILTLFVLDFFFDFSFDLSSDFFDDSSFDFSTSFDFSISFTDSCVEFLSTSDFFCILFRFNS